MRHRKTMGRFPVQANRASTPWRGAKEVSGVALVVAQEVPTSSSMAVPHGPAGVGEARRRMRAQLRGGGVAESVIDDAVLILSELLSNACKHGRPLGGAPAGDGDVRAAWRVDAGGRLIVEVTDGGGPTRPAPATPSVTAHGGRGLNIITALADDWGVRDEARGEVTVWVVVHGDVHDPDAGCRRDAFATRVTRPRTPDTPLPDLALPALAEVALPDLSGLDFAEAFEDLD
ncbi:ATP-binding protein [Streptomyces sp. NPDC017405]|uniref:ATP-binding protein n=1 Tax=unclassified Streptomyces TaxID=2593676 RepID=UPI00379CABE1